MSGTQSCTVQVNADGNGVADILDIFQQAANAHATQIGCDGKTMLGRNRLWVLLRVAATVDEYDFNGASVTTWASKGKLDINRSYTVQSNGKTVARGISKWCVIDAVRRRITADTGLPDSGSTLPPVDIANPKLQVPPTGGLCFTYTVVQDDIDINGHMNNVRYALLVQRCISGKINGFCINFVNELMLGQQVAVYRCVQDNTVTVWGESNGKTSFIFEGKYTQ